MNRSRLNSSIFLVLITATCFGLLAARALAQSDNAAWTPAVNISRSGAASRPAIAAAADGILHTMWWDTTEGELYARTTGITDTTWTLPVTVPFIIGSRSTDQLTGRDVIAPPRDVRLVANTRGDVHAFWFDATGQLLSSINTGEAWSQGVSLAEAAATIDAAADVSGTLHVAYVQPLNTATAPAGIYYRSTQGAKWSNPNSVVASAYFRTSQPADAHLSVAGDGRGNVLIAWDDPQLGQSVYARSINGGTTWTAPQIISGTVSGRPERALVAAAPNGEFLMLWQDASLGGCGFTQRRSSDGGETWTAPERVLSAISRCNAQWSFMPDADGKLWMISRAAANGQTASLGSASVVVWDGKAWSEPRDITQGFFDSGTNRSVALGCLNVAVAGRSAGLIGCDPIGDVWSARNAIEINQLPASVKNSWNPINVLSERTSSATLVDVPDIAADTQGGLYAVWSQAGANDNLGTALYAAAWKDGRWTTGAKINTGSSGKAEQATLATDGADRVHVVWSGGASGEIFYTWAYARDVGATQGWSQPTLVSTPGALGRWPHIVADPSNKTLYVAYALPFNEQRGVYLTRSTDDGSTWISRTLIFDAAAAKWDSVDKPRLALDPSNNILHAVWLRTALPGAIGASTVYYARSTDGGQTWSEPLKVTDGAVDWPRVIVPAPGQVYIAWNQAQSTTSNTWPSVWGQYSSDAGQRWTEPASVRGFDRVSGPIGLATDGGGQMFMAGMGQGVGNETVLLSATWLDQGWGAAQTDGLGQTAMLGNAASVAVASPAKRLGALLHLWMLKQDGVEQFQTVITDRAVNVQVVEKPAATFTPLPPTSPTPIATPHPTPTPKPQLTGHEPNPPSESGGPPPLVVGGVLAAAIIIIAAAVVFIQRR